MSALAKKYSDLLTKEDVRNILSLLPEDRGISGIAEKCNVTRRTIYQFEKSRDVRAKTRIKILDACLQTNPDQTLKFLVERSKEKSASILMTYLSHLYKEAISTDMIKGFDVALRDFLETRERHFGLISDEISDEVETMTGTLYEKVLEYGVELPLESVRTTSTSHIIEVIPYIINEIRSGRFLEEDIARIYRVPLELTRRIGSSFESPDEKLKFDKYGETKTASLAATIVPSGFKADRRLLKAATM